MISKSEKLAKVLKVILALSLFMAFGLAENEQELKINEDEYFEMPGLNVFAFQNTYPDGHQGGVEIIQHDNRVASCGNVRLSVSPGQWMPIPKIGEKGMQESSAAPSSEGIEARNVDRDEGVVSAHFSYPYESRDSQGFNPIIYPDLELDYNVRVKALEGSSFKIIVDLENPLPEEWVGRVGFNLELFPANLYGKHYYMDDESGIFPRQPNGPGYENEKGNVNPEPLAKGKNLVVAPNSEKFRMKIENKVNELELLDGAFKHANGWFVVRSLIEEGATDNAVEWVITPNVKKDWQYGPVINISQVGYHTNQDKTAIIELDDRIGKDDLKKAQLKKVKEDGTKEVVKEAKPEFWGDYLRYNYAKFDFSDVKESGLYEISYGSETTNTFRINQEIYDRHVWQPTLGVFLPEQMCHMRVNQKYRVWHGECHMDDALMAPNNINHFDGYTNEREDSTLSTYEPLDHVPGLNKGGWHDASDYDLRIETQASTVRRLSMVYEEFDIDYDQTYISQRKRLAEVHKPDGDPDVLQQVEHGVLSIIGGYKSLGRFYDGIIVPTLRQYVHLGDPSTHTDNTVFDNAALKDSVDGIEGLWYKKVANQYSKIFDPDLNYELLEEYAPDLDDRLVFTEDNPGHQIYGATGLAASARVLKGYNDKLARESLQIAKEVWERHKDTEGRFIEGMKVNLLTELLITTEKEKYAQELIDRQSAIVEHVDRSGWIVGRAFDLIEDDSFKDAVTEAAKEYEQELDEKMSENPFYALNNRFHNEGPKYYYLHKIWPEIFDSDYVVSALEYQLGVHPGKPVTSLVSGVGSNSPTIAYSPNRADWSYVPGGTFWGGLNILNPDFPENKEWPYMWQEREYITNGAVSYIFTVLGVNEIMSEK